MTTSSPRAPRALDPRLEAAATRLLEQRRGRAAIAAPPRAGGLATSLLAPLLKDRGVGLGDLRRRWPEIVGERLAGLTQPEKLQAGAEGSVLTVRAHASAAPFVQHQAKLIIERANLAGAKVSALQIKQGAPSVRAPSNVGQVQRPLSPEEEALVLASLARFEPGPLRSALLRLGRAVAAR
jgi:hypothetical protein